MSRLPVVISFLIAGLMVSNQAAARDSSCSKPPEFKGCPTGEEPFSVTGEAFRTGTVKYMNFGDELVVAGGEGGLRAVTLWGRNSCGLWLQVSTASGYIGNPNPRLRKPTYQVVKLTKKNTFKITILNCSFLLQQIYPGRFQVTLLTDIPEYVGE